MAVWSGCRALRLVGLPSTWHCRCGGRAAGRLASWLLVACVMCVVSHCLCRHPPACMFACLVGWLPACLRPSSLPRCPLACLPPNILPKASGKRGRGCVRKTAAHTQMVTEFERGPWQVDGERIQQISASTKPHRGGANNHAANDQVVGQPGTRSYGEANQSDVIISLTLCLCLSICRCSCMCV